MRCAALASAVVVLALAAACGGAAEQGQVATEPVGVPAAPTEPARGGTLRVGVLAEDLTLFGPFDPQFASPWSLELFRCCLVRTLVSYVGRPTAEGGAELRPDLATGLPDVSSDGLTWTFRLQQRLRHAPPFEDTEIVAEDVIRALERAISLASGNSGYYLVIEGAQAFADGGADSISGLEAPDPYTLVVHLAEPAGDLAARFALPDAAPIPPGAADGHDEDYGQFLVASGPYMLAGSQRLDFSLPATQQKPAEGYVPGESITLVRNPSWDRASDGLRPAYADRIEVSLGGTHEGNLEQLEQDRLDVVLDSEPPPDVVRRYRESPELEGRLFRIPADITWFLSMNLAVPPFDDLHVRKAVNLAIDKAELRRLFGSAPLQGFGWVSGDIARHVLPDSLESNLLLDYDPYATPGHAGDIQAARAEMAESRHDADGDGLCDNPACEDVLVLVRAEGGFPAMATEMEHNLDAIGIGVSLEVLEPQAIRKRLGDPSEKVPLALFTAWERALLSGGDFVAPLFYGPGIEGGSLVGATPEQLSGWGYEVSSVPSIDGKIEACLQVIGGAQVECWAEADQLLMEEVVPWVPYLSGELVRTVSSRVARFSYAQFTKLPALDQIALRPEQP